MIHIIWKESQLPHRRSEFRAFAMHSCVYDICDGHMHGKGHDGCQERLSRSELSGFSILIQAIVVNPQSWQH